MYARREPARAASGGRKAAQSEATRAHLIEVATRLFAEHGYGGVGTQEIVRQAGVTRGALYHHFADKRELFRAVHERLERRLTAGIAASVVGVSDPMEGMKTGLRAYLDACVDPAVGRITLIEAPAVLGWEEWREIDARNGLGLVRAALQAAMDAGMLARRPVTPLAQLLLAAMAEAGLLVATSADPAATLDAVEEPLLALIAGLRH
jgi:AcrR family transcriptional regulator